MKSRLDQTRELGTKPVTGLHKVVSKGSTRLKLRLGVDVGRTVAEDDGGLLDHVLDNLLRRLDSLERRR